MNNCLSRHSPGSVFIAAAIMTSGLAPVLVKISGYGE
jgi:hypothetical protein